MYRKEFLKYTLHGLLIPLTIPTVFSCNSKTGKREKRNITNKNFEPDVDVELTSVAESLNILTGKSTNIYRYSTKIIGGNENVITHLPETYLGPVFRVKNGQKIRIRYRNQLPRESVIHWHGLHIPPEMDGHPMYAVNNGEEYIYEFTVNNPPGTYWFHPHPDKITGPQVYHGLAGLFIVEDDSENLPKGKYDLPLIIQDRMFDNDNQLLYLSGNRMMQMQGFLGNQILVNGNTSRQQSVERTAYRFRVLNGSNSRIYKLAWSDDSPITVVATDGGLLSRSIDKPYLILAPGERVELWKNFSSYEDNGKLILKSLSFNDGTTMGMGGMMGNMGMNAGSPNGQQFDLMVFNITGSRGKSRNLPDKLTDLPFEDPDIASNSGSPRKFHFYNEHMQWVINGETFRMHEVADWEKVKAGTSEIWEFINGNDGNGRRGGMGMMQNMMQMPHPVHIHGFSFRIVERDVSAMDPEVWNSIKDGFVDDGFQDTFLLMPGMKVKIFISFEDFTGKYIYHCHNLEHEDMGMMRNFEISEQNT